VEHLAASGRELLTLMEPLRTSTTANTRAPFAFGILRLGLVAF
jgi:hypothetical protein